MVISLKMQAALAAPVIRPFLSRSQLAAMADGCRGEEMEFFLQKFVDLAQQIETMPQTYGQDGKGDQATAHLHYFIGGSDWYITEKDMDGGIQQAFGYAILNGDDECAELGYISIEELTRHGVELDLYFTPCTLAEIKARRAGRNTPEAANPKPWVVVTHPGQDDEDIVADFPTYEAAMRALPDCGEGADVMKRLANGVLTTLF
jgi:hypothetical protein